HYPGYLRQNRENFDLHSVSEEGVGFVLAQVLKWQHRDRFLRHRRSTPAEHRTGRRCGSFAIDLSARVLARQSRPPPPDANYEDEADGRGHTNPRPCAGSLRHGADLSWCFGFGGGWLLPRQHDPKQL